MRSSTLVVSVVVTSLASLACAGLPLPGSETDLPEEAAALAVLDVADATPITVATLEPTDDGCAWTARSWPGGEAVTIAAARVACPDAWLSTADEGHAALLGAQGGALVIGDVATPVVAPPAMPEAVAFSGDELWICARVEAELLDEPRRFRFEGKDHEAPDEGALARSWRFADGAWVVGETAPVAVESYARPCAELPSFPDSDVSSAPALQPETDDFSRAEGADEAALKVLQDGDWSVSEDGWFAARSQAVEAGPQIRAPLAWRAEAGPWKLVDGVAEGDVFFANGPWLLVVSGAKSRLLDARMGSEVWKADGVAAVWPDGVTVPEGHAEPADGAAPAPGSGPPRAKAGHKRPGGGGKAPGKLGKKAPPAPR